MVKILLVLAFVSAAGSLVQGQEKINVETCESNLMQQVQEQGLRSLNGKDIISYYLDLRKCSDKNKTSLLRRQAEQRQLLADLQNSKQLRGFTSGAVYSTLFLIIYLIVN